MVGRAILKAVGKRGESINDILHSQRRHQVLKPNISSSLISVFPPASPSTSPMPEIKPELIDNTKKVRCLFCDPAKSGKNIYLSPSPAELLK
jgi:hypothetical protein